MKQRSFAAALLLCALLAVLGLPGGAHAQGVTTSAVAGRVLNQEQQPVAAAQVTATNQATGISQSVVTRADGRYLIAGLQPGTYTVSASALGYGTQSQPARLVLSQTADVSFALTEQALVLETLTVSAEQSPVFSPTRTGTGTTVTESTIRDLPTLNRDFTSLAALSPYVTTTGAAPSIAGQNNRYNNIQIDGAVNNDVFGLAASGVPGGQANAKAISLDAIAEFQVQVAPFDVRQAGFSGGLINAVTKSGTNRFSGSGFFGYRDLGLIREELSFNAPGVVPLPQTVTAGSFENKQYGFTFGGPIIRDRLHFFAATEWEDRVIPELFGISSGAASIRVQPDSILRFASLLEGYGVNPGILDTYSLANPAGNVFGRLDFQVNPNHRLTLRHNHSRASDDDAASRGGSTFELESATYDFINRTNSTVLELQSQFGSQTFNEVIFNYQTVRDRRAPAPEYRYGVVNVRTSSVVDGVSLSSTLRAGAEQFSHSNELDQNIFQLTNNLTRSMGAHRLTLGGQVEHYNFRNLFVPASLGVYSFNSLADFEANTPSSYTVTVPYTGVDDPAARFDVLQLSAYLQDQWTVSPSLTLSLGLRADNQRLLDTPVSNPDFVAALGYDNAVVPESRVLLSPRVGFNWQALSGPQTQIRGGVGVFTGRPPFVWLSNAFGNTGRNTLTLVCSGANAPGFSANTPTACVDGTTAAAGGVGLLNTLAEDFSFPQDVKASLAVDRELPFGFTATVEGLYTRAINAIYVVERNLREGRVVTEPGVGTRVVYGDPVASFATAYRARRINDTEFAHTAHAQNTNEPYSYLVSASLRRLFFGGLDLSTSYTYSRAFDIQTQNSSQATSNIGFSPVGYDLMDLPLTRSDFDRPHKVVVSASTSNLFSRFGGTDLAVFYIGQSGRPYSYTIDGDVNGDGYEDAALVSNRNNDLVYIPASTGEIAFQNADQERLFNELVSLEPCLQEQRGQIMERNSCRAPWTNQVDVKLRQGLPIRAANGLKLEVDIFNFGNLLNGEWGLQRGPANSTTDLLFLRGRVGNDPTAPMQFSYDSFTERDEDGVLRATKPYSTFFGSRYQIRVGARVDF